MPQITYIEYAGQALTISAGAGVSVMEAAVQNRITGIAADCGGACTCATCHVYVDENWLTRTGSRSEMETSMLDFVTAAKPNSRLSCQIKMTNELDGLVVHLPESQY